MRSYLEYYILKEYKRLGKLGEYRALKKKLVEILNQQKWTELSAKLLEEDWDFAADSMQEDSTGLAIQVQLDELTSSNETVLIHEEKFKYFARWNAVGNCWTK